MIFPFMIMRKLYKHTLKRKSRKVAHLLSWVMCCAPFHQSPHPDNSFPFKSQTISVSVFVSVPCCIFLLQSDGICSKSLFMQQKLECPISLLHACVQSVQFDSRFCLLVIHELPSFFLVPLLLLLLLSLKPHCKFVLS